MKGHRADIVAIDDHLFLEPPPTDPHWFLTVEEIQRAEALVRRAMMVPQDSLPGGSKTLLEALYAPLLARLPP